MYMRLPRDHGELGQMRASGVFMASRSARPCTCEEVNESMMKIALVVLAAALGTGGLLGGTAAQAGGYGYDAYDAPETVCDPPHDRRAPSRSPRRAKSFARLSSSVRWVVPAASCAKSSRSALSFTDPGRWSRGCSGA